ncbi:MAG TPA: hypothetical protein VLB27_08640 [candidate division Zixibacteria bacterium]|nr:hypothetical protein [candidate division Zixibacteria bacterium]
MIADVPLLDMMLHEIATSRLYAADPVRIREAWAFRDVLIAYQMLEWYAETTPDGTDD